MNVLDIAMAAVVLLSVIISLWRGLIFELLSVAAWVGAFFVAQWWAPGVQAWLPLEGASPTLRYAAAFVLVFVVAAFAGGFLAWIGRRVVEALGLRPMDRTLGIAFGLVRGVVLLLAGATLVLMTPLAQESWWTQSWGADWLTSTLRALKPMLPADFAQRLPL